MNKFVKFLLVLLICFSLSSIGMSLLTIPNRHQVDEYSTAFEFSENLIDDFEIGSGEVNEFDTVAESSDRDKMRIFVVTDTYMLEVYEWDNGFEEIASYDLNITLDENLFEDDAYVNNIYVEELGDDDEIWLNVREGSNYYFYRLETDYDGNDINILEKEERDYAFTEINLHFLDGNLYNVKDNTLERINMVDFSLDASINLSDDIRSIEYVAGNVFATAGSDLYLIDDQINDFEVVDVEDLGENLRGFSINGWGENYVDLIGVSGGASSSEAVEIISYEMYIDDFADPSSMDVNRLYEDQPLDYDNEIDASIFTYQDFTLIHKENWGDFGLSDGFDEGGLGFFDVNGLKAESNFKFDTYVTSHDFVVDESDIGNYQDQIVGVSDEDESVLKVFEADLVEVESDLNVGLVNVFEEEASLRVVGEVFDHNVDDGYWQILVREKDEDRWNTVKFGEEDLEGADDPFEIEEVVSEDLEPLTTYEVRFCGKDDGGVYQAGYPFECSQTVEATTLDEAEEITDDPEIEIDFYDAYHNFVDVGFTVNYNDYPEDEPIFYTVFYREVGESDWNTGVQFDESGSGTYGITQDGLELDSDYELYIEGSYDPIGELSPPSESNMINFKTLSEDDITPLVYLLSPDDNSLFTYVEGEDGVNVTFEFNVYSEFTDVDFDLMIDEEGEEYVLESFSLDKGVNESFEVTDNFFEGSFEWWVETEDYMSDKKSFDVEEVSQDLEFEFKSFDPEDGSIINFYDVDLCVEYVSNHEGSFDFSLNNDFVGVEDGVAGEEVVCKSIELGDGFIGDNFWSVEFTSNVSGEQVSSEDINFELVEEGEEILEPNLLTLVLNRFVDFVSRGFGIEEESAEMGVSILITLLFAGLIGWLTSDGGAVMFTVVVGLVFFTIVGYFPVVYAVILALVGTFIVAFFTRAMIDWDG